VIAARSFSRSGDDEARVLVESAGPWILRARRSALRTSLGHRVMFLWNVAYEDAGGRVVESRCVPSIVEVRDPSRVRDRQWIAEILRQVDGEFQSLVRAFTADWRDAVERNARAFASVRLTRERAVAARLADVKPVAFQPGLFDRRAERWRAMAATGRQLAHDERATRIERLESALDISPVPPRLLLVLVP